MSERKKPQESSEKTIETRPVTIPVHLEIRSEGVVLVQPEMTKLLGDATALAVGPCACRTREQRCDGPLDVCLALDHEAHSQIETNGWKPIQLADALGILEETYRAGLVHLAYRNDAGEIYLVCSCCACCCGFLRSLVQRGSYKDALITSTCVAVHDSAACTSCGQCIDRCAFGAYARDPDTGKVTFDAEQCFGCGVCVEPCPADAPALLERRGATA